MENEHPDSFRCPLFQSKERIICHRRPLPYPYYSSGTWLEATASIAAPRKTFSPAKYSRCDCKDQTHTYFVRQLPCSCKFSHLAAVEFSSETASTNRLIARISGSQPYPSRNALWKRGAPHRQCSMLSQVGYIFIKGLSMQVFLAWSWSDRNSLCVETLIGGCIALLL